MTITILEDRRVALLHGEHSSYALAWDDPTSPLRHLHWGRRLDEKDAEALLTQQPSPWPFGAISRPRSSFEEFPVWGGLRREEVALKVTMPDGVRSLDLAVDAVGADHDTLTVTLRDTHYPVSVELAYTLDAGADAITRRATVRHDGTEGRLRVDRAGTASWALPARPGWRLSTAAGAYAAENHVERRPLGQGTVTLASRHGIAGHDFLPWVALDEDAAAHHGEVWAMTLAWSGSWAIGVHAGQDGAVHVIGGLEPSDADAWLEPGTSLELPPMTGVYSPEGHDGAARRFHRHARDRVVVQPQRPRPVIFNSWEATWFAVDDTGQRRVATKVADLGVELFVLDDGWFHGRLDDTRGLGDWWPDADKFPDGMAAFADHVHGLGMLFGLWVEPEMVSPDSDLYRRHPDWIHRWETREPTLQRHQYALDFGRADVRAWASEMLVRLVRDHKVDYLKWDMNRPIIEPAGPDAVRAHTLGVYEVWERLRAEFPDLWLENCASGGGRPDHGALARCHWTWTSDDTDPVERLPIQHGFARINPPATMCNWVSGARNPLTARSTPLAFRFHVAMPGVLGLSFDPDELTDVERGLARGLVAQYKQIRPLVTDGTRWELPAPARGMSALALVSEDQRETAVLAWGPRIPFTHGVPRLLVHGLRDDLTYTASVGEGSTDSGADGITASGAWLRSVGLPLWARGDHASWLIRLTAN